MPILSTPASVDTYNLPADALLGKAALLAALAAAATKIRIAMFTLTDRDLITAIIAAHTRGLTDIKLAIDFSQAHSHYEHQAIAMMRATLTPAKVIYTTSPVHGMIMHHKLCTIDDTISIAGSANWTAEAWGENNQLQIITNATLAASNSAAIDTAAAYGLAHLPQT